MPRVLILGGTRDALELAGLLHEAGLAVTTSLAGVTEAPAHPRGALRLGGFGGIGGLAEFARGFDLIADATHPFAARISAHAAVAAQRLNLPILRLERPPWCAGPEDDWIHVAGSEAAAEIAPDGARLFVTTGRKGLAPFLARPGLSGIVRMIEEPGHDMPGRWTLVRARPPFTVAQEADLLSRHAITFLVTKNSGGPLTAAKLVAAQEKKIPVIMIARPGKPPAETFATAQSLGAAILRRLVA